MADKKEDEELKSFLSKVEEVESIIKGLSCPDSEKQNLAMQEADKFLQQYKDGSKLCETGVDEDVLPTKCDRTVINKSISDVAADPAEGLNLPAGSETLSPETFMKNVEEDAKKRATRKKEQESKAQILKEQGNTAFKDGRHEEAILWYSKAIEELKTNTVLYTNRAQAFIKLGKYDAAIEDCKQALKVDSSCVKAYVHTGRSLQAKGQFDKALAAFRKAMEVAPSQQKILQEYITEAEVAQKLAIQENKALKLVSSGSKEAADVKELILRLNKKNLQMIDYMEATKKLVLYLDKDVHKTLFRTCDGFFVVTNNVLFKRYWDTSTNCTDIEHVDFVCEVVGLLTEACTENDANVQEFLKKDHSASFSCLLRDPTSPVIKSAVTSLLHQLSQTDKGRRGLLHYNGSKRFVEALLLLVQTRRNIAIVAMSTINNFALECQFCEQHRDLVNKDFLKAFNKLVMKTCECETTSESVEVWSLASSALSAVANLAQDVVLRIRVSANKETWCTSVSFMENHTRKVSDSRVHSTMYAFLGLLANISVVNSASIKEMTPRLLPHLSELLNSGYEDLVERSAAVVKYILGHSKEAVTDVCEKKIYVQFINLLKDSRESTKKHVIKCLAICTLNCKAAREAVLKGKGLKALTSLLSSEDQTVIGNAAFCLRHCAESSEVCKQIPDPDIVQTLLKHATNDSLNQDVKQNAAICLAKLATGEPRWFTEGQRAENEIISSHLLWKKNIPIRRRRMTYPQMLSRDTGIGPDDLSNVMLDRDLWNTVVQNIPASGGG